MKPHIVALAASVLLGAAALTTNAFMNRKPEQNTSDESGHVLTALWKEYDDAAKADRPKKQVEILGKIIEEAKARRLHWDFYDAADRSVSVQSRRNWKLRDSLNRWLSATVDEYDEPIVTYSYGHSHRGNQQMDFVLKNRNRLQAGRNEAFYPYLGVSYMMSGVFVDYIKDDYEALLWTEFQGSEWKRASESLEEVLGTRYPQSNYLEYLLISKESRKDEDRKAALAEYARKNSTNALGCYAKGDLLVMKMDSLGKAKAKSDDYKAFHEECKAFEKARKSFGGADDRRIAGVYTNVESLVKQLESKSVGISIKLDTAYILLRNLDKVKVTMKTDEKNPKTVLSTTLDNPSRSFYAIDTLAVAIPRCDDGFYFLKAENGKESYEIPYSRHTLSIAVRGKDNEVYVADWKTGEPIGKADFKLSAKGSTLAEIKDVKLDGFTKLPDSFMKKVRKNVYTSLEASLRDEDGFLRTSNKIGINRNDYVENLEGERSEVFMEVFTDRGAYNPGDTAHFKAILYKGNRYTSLQTIPAGRQLSVSLRNPSGEEKDLGLSLVTNEYGSVAGDIPLPVGERNGYFAIIVKDKGSDCQGRALIRVDEYVLPTFDLSFDDIDKLYFSGDTVDVKGTVKSYSGHPLSSADVTYTVSLYGRRIDEGKVELEKDGRFNIRFKSEDQGRIYTVVVKVTDETGESHEYTRRVLVLDIISIEATLQNEANGSVRLPEGQVDYLYNGRRTWVRLVSDDQAVLKLTAYNAEHNQVPMSLDYELKDPEGNVIESGKAESGSEVSLNLPKSVLYTLEVRASVKNTSGIDISAVNTLAILKIADDDKVLATKVENVFKLVGPCSDGKIAKGEDITIQFGSGNGPVWAVADLFDAEGNLVEHQKVTLAGKVGEEGSLKLVSFKYKEALSEGARVILFYFKDGRHYTFNKEFEVERDVFVLPLEFTSFEDKTLPGREYTVTLRTDRNVEAVAAVFDKSTETIRGNSWGRVSMLHKPLSYVHLNAVAGGFESDYFFSDAFLNEKVVIAYGVSRSSVRIRGKAAGAVAAPAPSPDADVSFFVMQNAEMETADEAIPFQIVSEAVDAANIRSDFSTTLAFEPFLRSDKDGVIELRFKTSDKLSTFIVQLFAHNKDFQNQVVRKEMTVTLPVKMEVAEPQYLYRGDKYVLHATVSSTSDQDVSGFVTVQTYPSEDYENFEPMDRQARKVTVPAGGVAPVEFEIDPKDADTLGMKLVFVDEGNTFSDGVFVSLPVHESKQVLTESHSAVYRAGMDKEALQREIASRFTGTTANGAEYSERNIRQMLLDAIPSKVEPEGKDVLSLSEALYVRRVARKLGSDVTVETPDSELVSKILACRNADGGFGWFEGMRSSPVITAVLLERFAKMRDTGLMSVRDSSSVDAQASSGADAQAFDPVQSIKFLDRNQFIHSSTWPYWTGWLSQAQYIYVRSMYSDIEFDVETLTKNEKSEYSKNFKEFKSYVKDYLTPKKRDGRGMRGQVLAKSRRIKTLLNLTGSDAGVALAKQWGIRLSAATRMDKSMAADVTSVLEYAVEHRDGGWYYPNAVMPWRGLLESEAYAHSLLCDLFTDSRVAAAAAKADGLDVTALQVADGIRIWLMLQKETQHWDTDPAFVDAINSVMTGSEEVLSTSVLVATKTYEKPIEEIVAAGNGFTIERNFYREVVEGAPAGTVASGATGSSSSSAGTVASAATASSATSSGTVASAGNNGGRIVREEIRPGTVLHVGDKIVCEYKVWNQENRSFVKLTAPREAGLRPVDQLSGHYGWRIRPLSIMNSYSMTPQGYRNVRIDCTEYFFDVYPEENTTVTEEFFVTQEGTFIASVVTIESLYAPHYRANAAYEGQLVSEK